MKIRIILVVITLLLVMSILCNLVFLWSRNNFNPHVIKSLDNELKKITYSESKFGAPSEHVIEIMNQLVELENKEYVAEFLKFTHHNCPEGINRQCAELIIKSNSPTIWNIYESWVNYAFEDGLIDDSINYAPYIYMHKDPKKLLIFFQRLAQNDPDWQIKFPYFKAELLIDWNKTTINGLNPNIAKDYEKAINRFPSEYTKQLCK